MKLSMGGHVSGILKTHNATQRKITAGYVDGIWVEGMGVDSTPVDVNIQPASMREIQSLSLGGRRINDTRRVYINTSAAVSLAEGDLWLFDNELSGKAYECISFDYRPTRDYCKLFVSIVTDNA